MSPVIQPDDDEVIEIPAAPSPETGSEATRLDGKKLIWLRRLAIVLGLMSLAIYGFGNSAGWFDEEKNQGGLTGEPLALEDVYQSTLPAESSDVITRPDSMTPGVEATSQRNDTLSPALPLAALVPDNSLDLIAECRRVGKHLSDMFPDALEAREMQARVEFELGDVEQASKIWLSILDVNPNYVHALRGLGDVCTLNGELAEAVEYFRRAVLADPNASTRQVTLGVALLQAAEVEQSIEVLQKVLERDPAHVGAHAALGNALSQARNYEAAVEHYKIALEAEDQLADPAKVHFGLATVLQRLGKKEAARAHQADYARLRNENNSNREEQRRSYEDVQAISIDAGRMYVDMARVYLAGGQSEAAELLLLRASRMNPDDIDCRQALAFLAVNGNRPYEAIRWLREVADLQPHEFSAVREIARLYAEVQAHDNAERILVDYFDRHPQSPEVLAALTEFYLVVKPNGDQAVQFAKACIEAEPTAANYARWASAEELNENPLVALTALEQAVVMAPSNPLYSQRLELLREILSKTQRAAVK